MHQYESAPGLSIQALRHQLAQAENEAALALRRSTQALIAWGDAEAEGDKQKAHEAKCNFEAARCQRILADSRADYWRAQLRRATGRAA